MNVNAVGTMEMPLLDAVIGQRPYRIATRDDVSFYIRESLVHNANDVHINIEQPIVVELDGAMYRVSDRPLEASEFEIFANYIRDKEGAMTILGQKQDYDGAITISDGNGDKRRLRVNMTGTLCVRNGGRGGRIVMRPLSDVPPRPEDIGLGQDLLDRLYPQKGAVYVIGPTGSGKTTSFASLFREAAETGRYYHGHLATYEAPPEFDLVALSSKHLLITQTAINEDWGLASFADGVRNALRCHPSAIMIGEVRDLETVQAVIEAALTGHPVFGTVHADRPAVAFQRLISRFPAQQQDSGKFDLIMTTEVILAQRLVPKVGGGRIAVREWIAFNDEIRDKLLQCANSGQIALYMQRAVEEFGQSFAMDAKRLLDNGLISVDTYQSVLSR